MHRVRKGESLKIARKYDVSVVTYAAYNLVPTDDNPHFVAIKIGQILTFRTLIKAEQPTKIQSLTKSSRARERVLRTKIAEFVVGAVVVVASSSSSSSNTNNKVAVVQVNNKSTSSGTPNRKPLLVTVVLYLRAG